MNQALYEGRVPQVTEMTEQALAEGRSAHEVLQEGLIAGMSVVGEDFKHNRVYVPQVLIAARAMKAGMAVLKPLLSAGGGAKSMGTVVMGTVKGDLHDIGKNLVCMMAEGAGFKIVDLGIDQSADKFVAAVREQNAGIVGMSALLTTTMPYMRVVIDTLKQEGLGARQGLHRRRAGESNVCRRNRCRRIWARCDPRGRVVQGVVSGAG